MSVSVFRYEAVNRSGSTVRGQVSALDEREAYRQLAAGGLTPTRLSPARQLAAGFGGARARPRDVAAFTRELAVLLEAKIPLSHGLSSIAESEENAAMRGVVLDLASRVQAGESLGAAFARHRLMFGDVYVETVRSAEHTGELGAIVAHLAVMLEKQAELRQQLVRAVTYPIIVLTVVALALTVILVFVVPKFSQTFASSELELPLATKLVQGLSGVLRGSWYAVVGGVVGVVGGLSWGWRDARARPVMERALLRVPVIKRVLIATAVARFARVLGVSAGAGLELTEALPVAGGATGRPVFAAECRAMASRMSSGDDLATVLAGSAYLPAFARRMLAAGTDRHEVTRSCEVVARHYERESEHLTSSVGQAIEPVLTVCLAVIVLVVALAVFLPMWQMVKM